jgi:hypothetical protein
MNLLGAFFVRCMEKISNVGHPVKLQIEAGNKFALYVQCTKKIIFQVPFHSRNFGILQFQIKNTLLSELYTYDVTLTYPISSYRYAPRHKSCPLCAFEIVEKSDTFCDGEHTYILRCILFGYNRPTQSKPIKNISFIKNIN